MEAVRRRQGPIKMDHEEEEDVDDPQQDSRSGHSTESEEATDQSSGSPSSEGSPKHDDEMGEVSQDNTDDNTDVDDGHEPLNEIRDGEFQFQVQSFHIVTVNARQGKKQFKCDVCTGTYQHAFSLKRHFLRTHVNYKYLSEADITNCNINLNLVRQLREESDSLLGTALGELKFLGLYRCHLCSALFDVRDELKAHVSSHVDDNGQKGFSCGHCEMTFTHRQNLVRHQSVHSGEKQFFCKHCDKSFPNPANRRRHEKIHESSDLPFPCSFCAASFDHGVHLQKHLRKHHPEHYYPCEFCSKFFLEEGQLKKHRATHRAPIEGSKGCKPPEAHAVFRRKRVKGCEPENKYLCSICKRRFTTFISLRQHKISAHAAVQQEKRTRSLQPRKEPISVRSRSAKPAVKELSEEEFYMTIAHRISENLLYHLDGKSTQLNIKHDPCAFPEEKSEKATVQYSIHNFPAAFDITQMMQIYSNRVPSSNHGMSNDGSDNSEETESIFLGGSQQDHSWPQKSNGVANFRSQKAGENVIGRNIPVTFICSVCASKFSSRKAIDEHKINNHPNVVCTHVEVEGENEVPPELCWTFTSPVGFLQSNTATMRADPAPAQENLVCTKCSSSFTSRVDLHQHILDCGTNSGFQKQLTRGYSVHSRLGCSVRQLSVTSREVQAKGKKRPHISESPFAEAKRAKAGVCSPQCDEQALDLKMHSGNTPAQSVPDMVVGDDKSSVEKQEDAVNQVESTGHTENTDDDVSVSQYAGGEHETIVLGTAVESADTEKVEESDTSAVQLDTAVVHDSDNMQQSSPEELVVSATSNHTHEAALVVEKTNDMPPIVPESSIKDDVLPQLREDSCEEVKAESDQFEFADIEQAPSPIFGEGRRVLRSKTAAASNATGGASSTLVNSHTCSTCKRSFTYLASLKKHLRDICPNKKVAGQKVVKRRKAAKISRKESTSSEIQTCTEPVQDDTDMKKESTETASSGLLSSVTFPEEADTSGLELLANASIERAAPSCPSGTSWSPSSCPVNAPPSTLHTKEPQNKVLAAPPRRLRGKERLDDATSEACDVDHKPDIRPHSQEHTCPYCLHSFAYLSNYRKHLREVCLLKKKAKQNGDGNESMFSAKTAGSDESRSLVDRADGPSTITMSFKGRIENSVINLLRNQSKQVELIGAQAAAVKDQPGGANHSSPNFMTFSCPVCHKIFLSYVKMLQHRLSHKLQTDEPSVKEEKADVPDVPDSHDVEMPSADDAGQGLDNIRRSDRIHSSTSTSVVKTDEDQRFDEILVGVRGGEGVENDALEEELKREEHNYAVSLAELDSLPDEDDGEDAAEGEETKESPSPVEVAPSEANTETKPTVTVKKTGTGKKSPAIEHGSRPSAKEKVRRGMRRLSGRASKTTSRDKCSEKKPPENKQLNETHTTALERLPNASSMEQAAPSGAASSGTADQPLYNVQPKELESKNLAAARGKAKRAEPSYIPGRSGHHTHEIKRNAQEHTCPYCLHPFVHLSNYRKHIREACLLKKKKNKRNEDGNEAVIRQRTTGADDSHSLERADCPAATNMSLKEPVENSVINMLRNQSKQVELIGAQAAAVKDQPCGANQSPPNFMTFSCTVCHKIFLSYVKMLQHRLSHKLQTDELSEKEEKTEGTDAVADVEMSSVAVARHSLGSGGQVGQGATAVLVVKTGEKCFNDIVSARGTEGVESSVVQGKFEREDPNCVVSLAELNSLPDEDDGEDEGEKKEDSLSLSETGLSETTTKKAARATRKSSAGKKRPQSEHASSKDKVQRKISGKVLKTTSRRQH
ncbi:uncharacterized protein [Dermacentor albipictus]|uniref:uncharacterized protein n=1 Tax=Dermacentor albipictus TaxID=60249 RepID=UPI0031FCDCF1